MKLICAWCKKVIREGDDSVISHGICPECAEKVPYSLSGKNRGYLFDRMLGGAIAVSLLALIWLIAAFTSEELHRVSGGRIPNVVPLLLPETPTPSPKPHQKHRQGRGW